MDDSNMVYSKRKKFKSLHTVSFHLYDILDKTIGKKMIAGYQIPGCGAEVAIIS